ncbi:MAG: carbohydrate kinase family protein [Pseudonocardiaceae bacterium]
MAAQIDADTEQWCDYIYLGGCFKLPWLLPYFLELAEEVRSHGVKIILDHGRVNDLVTTEDIKDVRALARVADFYLPSVGEFLSVWDARTLTDAARMIRSDSGNVVVVKKSDLGAEAFTRESHFSVPAYDVAIRNSVGAGDSFNAGLVRAQDLGLTLQESVEYACATAAIRISEPRLPTEQNVGLMLRRTTNRPPSVPSQGVEP